MTEGEIRSIAVKHVEEWRTSDISTLEAIIDAIKEALVAENSLAQQILQEDDLNVVIDKIRLMRLPKSGKQSEKKKWLTLQ
jgi:hypothetical protein